MALVGDIRRRRLLQFGGAAAASLLVPSAYAREEPQLSDVLSEAVENGLIDPQAKISGLTSDEEKQYLLAEVVANALSRNAEAPIAALAGDSGALLGKINAAVKIVGKEKKKKKRIPPDFEDLKDRYRVMFDACVIKDNHLPEVKRWSGFFAKKRNRDQYEAVERLTGVPWFFIAVLHMREASANFLGHLHNGDPLQKRTRQVPPNRPRGAWPPEPWDPVRAWVLSATDALTVDKFVNLPKESWTIERILHRFERYNGFGFFYHGYPSLYLWNFSNQSGKGGYASDGRWNPNYQSRQVGAAVLIKQMLNDQVITLRYES